MKIWILIAAKYSIYTEQTLGNNYNNMQLFQPTVNYKWSVLTKLVVIIES